MESLKDALKPLLDEIRAMPDIDLLPPEAVIGDSVLEEKFWDMMRQTDKGLRGTRDQFQIGPFRVDAAIECDGKLIVVELDGQAFHNYVADQERDGRVRQYVDAVIRIPFRCMWFAPNAVFRVLAEWYPRFSISTPDPRKVRPIVYSKDEFDAEVARLADEGIGLADIADDSSIEIYSLNATSAFVGTREQWCQQLGPPAIFERRGSGDPNTLRRLRAEIAAREVQGLHG